MAVAVERGSVEFGPFRVDLKTQRLYREHISIKLPRQSFLILKMLLERPGEVVTREELRAALWAADTFVDFDHGLNNAVNRVRVALNDGAEASVYIETLPRIGYRFVGSLKVPGTGIAPVLASVDGTSAEVAPAPDEDTVPFPQPRWKIKTFLASLVALALFLFVVWYFGLRVHRSPTIQSIAVLPLQNLSGDPSQEYFADGTTEELITMLAKHTNVKVISRTSAMQMKGVQKSVREIGRDLGVDAVVEGSVARSPQSIRITAQLIDARNDRHLWAEEYESPPNEIFQLQQRVARDISSQVSAAFSPQQDAKPPAARPVSPEAHDLYLQAQSYAAEDTPQSLKKSIELYQHAVGVQPDYAAAYSGIAESYCRLGSGWESPNPSFPRAREAALKALSLDNSAPGAHSTLAWIKHAYDWDTAGAETEFQAALHLNGNDFKTRAYHSAFLADVGRYDEGLAEARRAEDLDPLSVQASVFVERALMRGRRFEEFLKQAERSRKLDPSSIPTTYHSIIVYENLGRFEDAIHEMETHDKWEDPPEAAITNARQLREALRTSGATGYWRAGLQLLQKNFADDHVNIAHCYFMLGDKEAGLHELRLAAQQRDPALRFMITNSPWWDSVRNDARFKDLLHDVGY